MTTHVAETANCAVPAATPAPVARLALWIGRALSGFITLLAPWAVVTEPMHRTGYGLNENLARSLGTISLMCSALHAVPPTGFVGAILVAGHLGGAMASHAGIGSLLFTHILFGCYPGVVLWGGLWLRDRRPRPVATST